MKIGTTELIVVLIVALVIFGPSKLPALGKMAGKAVGSFRHYVNSSEGWDLSEELTKPVQAQPAAATTAVAAEPIAPVAATAAEPTREAAPEEA